MKVALNTESTTGQKSGFGWYVSNLLDYGPQNGIDYLSIARPVAEGEKWHDLSTPERFFWDQRGFAAAANDSDADLIHQPCFSAPVFSSKPVVLTLHDIIPTLFPENMALPSRLFFGKWMPFSARFAKHILTISEHSKQDLIKHIGIPEDKITVTPLAAGAQYHPMKTKAEQEQIQALREKYGITAPHYFLHVGTIEPRKNIPFLVKAYAEALKNGLSDTQLVITGKKGWRLQETMDLVEQLEVKDKVIFTDYAPDEDVPYLFAGARAFVFPSLYEGFGLPPAESMQCGVPTISSNTSATPEVVGEAGILLDPTDLDGWAKAMITMSTDDVLHQKLSKLSLEQVKKFSWEDTARLTATVYEKVLKDHTNKK